MGNDGKDLERLVQLIERSISPGSKVEHDVQLPVLDSVSGAIRQCDVVIWSGEPPRETVSVVEVQDREDRVKRNDFGGWKEKLEDVGAQHLICVSRHPFPTSIKEKAQLSGGSIRLVTLSALEPDRIPLDMFNTNFTYTNLDVRAVHGFNVASKKGEVPVSVREAFAEGSTFHVRDRLFSLDRTTAISLLDLITLRYERPDEATSGRGKLVFEHGKEPTLYFRHDGESFRIGLEFEFDWTSTTVDVPSSMLVYEQGDDGALAWVIEHSYDTPDGRGTIKMPTSKVAGGGYIVPGIIAQLPHTTAFRITTGRRDGSP